MANTAKKRPGAKGKRRTGTKANDAFDWARFDWYENGSQYLLDALGQVGILAIYASPPIELSAPIEQRIRMVTHAAAAIDEAASRFHRQPPPNKLSALWSTAIPFDAKCGAYVTEASGHRAALTVITQARALVAYAYYSQSRYMCPGERAYRNGNHDDRWFGGGESWTEDVIDVFVHSNRPPKPSRSTPKPIFVDALYTPPPLIGTSVDRDELRVRVEKERDVVLLARRDDKKRSPNGDGMNEFAQRRVREVLLAKSAFDEESAIARNEIVTHDSFVSRPKAASEVRHALTELAKDGRVATVGSGRGAKRYLTPIGRKSIASPKLAN